MKNKEEIPIRDLNFPCLSIIIRSVSLVKKYSGSAWWKTMIQPIEWILHGPWRIWRRVALHKISIRFMSCSSHVLHQVLVTALKEESGTWSSARRDRDLTHQVRKVLHVLVSYAKSSGAVKRVLGRYYVLFCQKLVSMYLILKDAKCSHSPAPFIFIFLFVMYFFCDSVTIHKLLEGL